ncbi:DNA mismatch repair protein MutS [Caldichromatium japonicum]|uniref:DNA mismatch repair protein MutS n=1 Tax=Caldichromatium japonicum TaxID=2699430 RepID=A0A6G7VDF5_9GAMM|nr:Smr/MutS family protein [Caldichromatium japonicum]QIK37906.1 DNA mismatch repair protein MutS [Caldichromatium japonicum]
MRSKLPESECKLFREQVEDVEPLYSDLAEPFHRRPPPIPRPHPPEPLEEEGQMALSESEVKTHDYLLFARPGLQRRVLAALQRGAFPIELEVDLHGLKVEHAHQVLAEFLADCRERRVRCVRIIHGKGKRSEGAVPVLKAKVNYWLRLYHQVLAFCSATQRDGGSGAVYVLLRNPDKWNLRRRPRRP